MSFVRVGMWRRVAALMLDWLACLAIANALTAQGSAVRQLAPLGIFALEVYVLTALSGASAGQRVLKMKVVRFDDGGRVSAKNVLIRTVLLCLVVTAVTFDENGRGLHERLSKSVLTRI
ncbi:unannotated protein [freshwater metagenome]|uniref:Unannotated protein n=1 Tax=freshwater metagenome TaxID=449393 RepID=A0A6J7V7M7_9ZZZZ|nr:RDD family protein [Actinomycetota bacterium]MSX48625.1 RDD family protein [Actinomycetota bacterium]MSX62689.1 RDD family protein [Actinomycetota bacterium]MSY09764.1 RDD family protein [Actinomycetota bacterium]MSY54226.1 RDD family protein [Actinomycetota bacterium]